MPPTMPSTMKPARLGQVNQLVAQRSILLVNQTNLGVGFVEAAVCRSPTFVTTKQGNKWLPTELWLMILGHAKQAEEDCTYVVMASTGVKRTAADSWILTLEEQLVRDDDVVLHSYRSDHVKYRPGGELVIANYDLESNQFFASDAPALELPAIVLLCRHPVVFAAATAYDLVWIVLKGNCPVCNGTRILRAKRDRFAFDVPCPVCRGVLYKKEWFRIIPLYHQGVLTRPSPPISFAQFLLQHEVEPDFPRLDTS